MSAARTCAALADLVAYPEADYAERLSRCERALLEEPGAEAARTHFARFAGACRKECIEPLQELYTRSFDLNPDGSLEVGWHLFGENYSRGEFLVEMRRRLRAHGIEESGELPDHLTYVLRVLERMEEGEAREFAARRLLPALDRILHGVKEQACLYEELLLAVRAAAAGLAQAASIEGGRA